MAKVALTQRDMLMQVYNAVVGNGVDGLIQDVKEIRAQMMTRGDCAGLREAESRGKDRRWDRVKGAMAIALPAASLLGVVLIAVLK